MNPQEFPFPSAPANRRENQIQGPRPPPLRVSKDSHKIRKPPIAPKPPLYHAPLQPPPAGNQPVIIYSVSPKPIYVEPSNFMSIVQRLTGRDTTTTTGTAFQASTSNSGEVPASPAARLAATERTSPREREERERRRGDMGDEVLVGYDVDASQMPGILSPAPANLPGISPGMFSPAAEAQNLFGFSDFMLSPFMGNGSSLMGSPSSLFFSGGATFLSPTPSPAAGEFFNLFDF